MKNNNITVSEALRKLDAGESVSDCSIDFTSIKVEALDVMKLCKGGIVVPETAIYYDESTIEFDEDFEGEWIPLSNKNESKTAINITLRNDIKQWVAENNVQLDQLIEKLIIGFYQSQK